jgi:hypothetical protein
MISDAKRLARFEDEMVKVRQVLGAEWDPIICWEPEPVSLSIVRGICHGSNSNRRRDCHIRAAHAQWTQQTRTG